MARDQWSKSDRRAFLQQCGRFAVVTPPVVTLMLSVSDKALAGNLATSGHSTKTKTTKTKTTSACTTETKIVTKTNCTVSTTTVQGFSPVSSVCPTVTKTICVD
jgi:hypothetical protein